MEVGDSVVYARKHPLGMNAFVDDIKLGDILEIARIDSGYISKGFLRFKGKVMFHDNKYFDLVKPNTDMLYIIKFRYADEQEDHQVTFKNKMIADNFYKFIQTNPYVVYTHMN